MYVAQASLELSRKARLPLKLSIFPPKPNRRASATGVSHAGTMQLPCMAALCALKGEVGTQGLSLPGVERHFTLRQGQSQALRGSLRAEHMT